uniref:Putative salivary cystatin n=1 Tax=Ixodes ricinus TaxID=34613 RepID=UPI002279E6EE|nr:ricistatin [Ixodes ricinus]7PK4_B Chain B, Putative salivary cystatin [Ixodes ricinus]
MELALRGGYRERPNHQEDPKYLELAHYATSTWSAQQPGKTPFDTVVEVLKVETQTVAGTNYRLTLKVAESTCELTSTYSKDACQPNANAAQRTCTTVIYQNLEGEKSVSSFGCAAA